MSIELSGFAELESMFLNVASSGIDKASRRAFSKGAKQTAQAIKDNIPSSQKDGRKAIGSSVKMSGGEILAKAGGAVGMTAKRLGKQKKSDRTGRKGVGISANNIDWALKGTADRHTGEKSTRTRLGRGKKSTGNKRRFTGRMPANNAVSTAWNAVQGAVNATIEDTFRAELLKESQ
jgi:hypothetical protein